MSPLTAAGSQNPLVDLLFSPRVAFIWDSTRHTVAWMNAAARSKFDLSLKDFAEAIPPEMVRQFSECAEAAERGEQSVYILKLKLGRARRPAPYSIDALELANGHKGLIVAEGGDARLTREPVPLQAKPKHKPRAPRRPKTLKKTAPPQQQLTQEEARALKAIGRTVRKLCEEKERARALSPAACDAKYVPARMPGTQAGPDLLFSAFDLVLFLDADFVIVRSEGRPQRVGLCKSRLNRKAAAALLPGPEQALFQRMVKKVNSSARICHETLAFSEEAGAGVPCRAVLGLWEGDGAHYFLALLSLKVPRRLKRFQAQVVSQPGVTRLAA
jgi:hypothetical protein